MPYSRTTWVNNSAPDINAANLNNIELGVVAAPYGPDASANFVPVWNGSIWTYSGVKNAHVDAAAAIAYSKLNLATSIVNGDISGSAAIAYSKLNLVTSILNADVATGAAIAVSKLAAGSNGQVLQTTAGVPTWGTATGATTYRKNTSKTVNNSVADTDLLNGEITIAANAIGANGMVRITLFGDVLLNVGSVNLPRFLLKLGGTTLLDTNTFTSGSANASRQAWQATATIMNLGATNSQWVTIVGQITSPSVNITANLVAFTTGEGAYEVNVAGHSALFAGGNSSNKDTTASQALVFSVVNGTASASYETKLYGALVEII